MSANRKGGCQEMEVYSAAFGRPTWRRRGPWGSLGGGASSRIGHEPVAAVQCQPFGRRPVPVQVEPCSAKRPHDVPAPPAGLRRDRVRLAVVSVER